MNIFVDVDGVVADLHAEWLKRYNKDYEDDLTVSRIHQWSMEPAVKPECGKKIYSYLHLPDLYDNVPPMPGALAGVRALREFGHRVVFLTSCVGPEMVEAKINWLFGHGFLKTPMYAGMKDLIIMQDKGLAKGDLLIDDYDGNCDAFDGPTILMDAPYNRAAKHLTRAHGWSDVIQRVLNLQYPED